MRSGEGATLRDVMRNYPQGVSVVAVDTGEGPLGTTASSLTSLSLVPPLVVIVLSHSAVSNTAVESSGVFCVNILSEEQGHLSEHFARPGLSSREQFENIPFHRSRAGLVRIEGCIAHLDCKVVKAVPHENHTIYVGEVEEAALPRTEARPLLYYNRGYWSVGSVVHRRD